MGYARGLIRYSTENAVAGKYAEGDFLEHLMRPRVLVYSGLLLIVIIGFFGGLLLKSPLKVDVIRDRGAMMRDAPGGMVENVYRLQFINTDEVPRRYGSQAFPASLVLDDESLVRRIELRKRDVELVLG